MMHRFWLMIWLLEFSAARKLNGFHLPAVLFCGEAQACGRFCF